MTTGTLSFIWGMAHSLLVVVVVDGNEGGIRVGVVVVVSVVDVGIIMVDVTDGCCCCWCC